MFVLPWVAFLLLLLLVRARAGALPAGGGAHFLTGCIPERGRCPKTRVPLLKTSLEQAPGLAPAKAVHWAHAASGYFGDR